MAEQKFNVNCGFFDAVENDRLYSAEDMNRPYKRIIGNGVFATNQGTPSTDLQVISANDGLLIRVKKGEGIFANKWFENPTDLTISVPINSQIVPRMDSVIVQVDKRQEGRVGNIVYRTGEPSSSPQPPAINTSETLVEYRVGNVYVAPSANWIGQDAITDLRGSNQCPWVTSLIKQVDTSTLFDQWAAAYSNYYQEATADFNDYKAREKAAFDAFMEDLTEELTVNTNMVKYESHYTTSSQGETVIPINISTYSKSKDVLMVRVNRLFATEGSDYTISNDGTSITLTKDLDKNQNVDFIVLQSVVVGDTATVLQNIQLLQNLVDLTKVTSNTGSTKINVNSGEDTLAKFVAAGKGFHTMYIQSGATNVPATGAYRAVGHLTGETAGWIMLMQASGSVYSNYMNEGVWRGWKVIHEVNPAPLWRTENGQFPTASTNVTPSKTLSECEHGWTLIWSGYDDGSKVGRDVYVQTTQIPKKSYKNANWNGEPMTIPLVYSYVNETDTTNMCQKTLYIYNDHISGGETASIGKQRNLVLRAIYEY